MSAVRLNNFLLFVSIIIVCQLDHFGEQSSLVFTEFIHCGMVQSHDALASFLGKEQFWLLNCALSLQSPLNLVNILLKRRNLANQFIDLLLIHCNFLYKALLILHFRLHDGFLDLHLLLFLFLLRLPYELLGNFFSWHSHRHCDFGFFFLSL